MLSGGTYFLFAEKESKQRKTDNYRDRFCECESQYAVVIPNDVVESSVVQSISTDIMLDSPRSVLISHPKPPISTIS